MICAPPCSELPSFQLEWRTHCYIHPRSLLARWSSGTANSGDFRGDSRLAQNFFRRGFLPFSVWRSLYLSRSLRGLEFRGTHHGRVGSWVGESLWCWSSLLLIGWLWAQLSSGSTHSIKHTYVYMCVCVRAYIEILGCISQTLHPKLWNMPTHITPPFWLVLFMQYAEYLHIVKYIFIYLYKNPDFKRVKFEFYLFPNISFVSCWQRLCYPLQ